MDNRALTSSVKNMIAYRKYGKILDSSVATKEYMFILGLNLPKAHPRYGSKALFMIDYVAQYSSNRMGRILDAIIAETEHNKLAQDSTFGLVLKYELQPQQHRDVMEIRSKIEPHFELFSSDYFEIDHAIPTLTSKWRIVAAEEVELLPGKLVDRPPLIKNDDVMIRYVGAINGDYVMFDRLELSEVGPRTYTTTKYVTDIQLQMVDETRGREEEAEDDDD